MEIDIPRDRVVRGCRAWSAAETERRWIHSLVLAARVPLADAEDVTQEVWIPTNTAWNRLRLARADVRGILRRCRAQGGQRDLGVSRRSGSRQDGT